MNSLFKEVCFLGGEFKGGVSPDSQHIFLKFPMKKPIKNIKLSFAVSNLPVGKVFGFSSLFQLLRCKHYLKLDLISDALAQLMATKTPLLQQAGGANDDRDRTFAVPLPTGDQETVDHRRDPDREGVQETVYHRGDDQMQELQEAELAE